MAVIGINYNSDEKNNIRYKSVKLGFGKHIRKNKTFKSNDFIKDWFNCIKYIVVELKNKEKYIFLSSVDHFIMDEAPYDIAYLAYDKNTDEHNLYYGKEWDEKGIKFFIPKNTKPTWEELKEMCK